MPTFPGVYPQIVDKSLNNGVNSRFSAGLVGPASRGAFNTATRVRNLSDFASKFGASVSGAYLAQAVSAITPYSDAVYVSRVGKQYSATTAVGSGTAAAFSILTSAATNFTSADYLRVSQAGKKTTPNARVLSVSVGTITLVSSGAEAVPLKDTYTAATIDKSATSGAANKAETLLTTPTYTPVAAAGAVTGNKNAFSFTVASNPTALAVGDVIKIEQSGRSTTREAVVKEVRTDGTILINTSTDTASGRQALPLQDNYTSGSISKQTGAQTTSMVLEAATEGTWANTVGTTTGVTVNVSPGSLPDTKKFLIYLDGALVSTFDNLSLDSGSDDYYVTRFTGSNLILVRTVVDSSEPPANTVNPWNTANSSVNVTSFSGGFNGSSVSSADYVGTYDLNENPSGLKVLDDPENLDLSVLSVPGVSDAGVFQELTRVAGRMNSFAILDVPDSVNARDAVDYQNGQGVYSNIPRIDNFRAGYFWNWFKTLNPFTASDEFVPPSVGVLAAMARTFAQYKPWFAAAGEQRGTIPIATAVRYPRVRDGVKQSMQGDGNCLNPVLLYRGTSILIYGNRTAQRLDSKLSSIHVVHLVNYLVKNMSRIGRKYVFDPNDPVLLDQLRLEYIGLLDSTRAERGVEAYQLTIDSTNNTAATRNARQVIVDLAIVPVDVAEQILINISVNESGAVINAINGGTAAS